MVHTLWTRIDTLYPSSVYICIMNILPIQPYCEIKGIGAASGLVYWEGSLYIISDNSTYLYQYELASQHLSTIKLFEDSAAGLSKKEKPDFESITLFDHKLYIVGSGSTPNRTKRVSYALSNKEIVEKDLSKIYKRLRKSIGLNEDELNIEGIIMNNASYSFFQRGNGKGGTNGIFDYNRNDKKSVFTSLSLPTIQGVEATFTDAVLIGDKVYFLAACEDSQSTYEDGSVLGSFIGCMKWPEKKVMYTHIITDQHKFEGLTLFEATANRLTFILCEDNDTEIQESVLYTLEIVNP
jgi:hypothetical protein